jgi:rubrerythrin
MSNVTLGGPYPKCLKCGTLFSSEGDQYCPTCYEDDDKEYKRWVDLWGED